MFYDDKSTHFVVTRPIWSKGSNAWLENLQKELDAKINLISIPFQTLDLHSKGFFLLKLLRWLNNRKTKKIILFTSPASVEAVNRIFDEIKIKSSRNSKRRKALNIVFCLINKFLKKKNIRFGAIGISTAKKIVDLSSRHFEKKLLKINDIYFVEKNATGKVWVDSFFSKIRNFNAMLIEGVGNKDDLSKDLRKYTIRLERVAPYKKNFILSSDFQKKINFLRKFIDNRVEDYKFSSNKFFILISASNFVSPLFCFFKKEGIPLSLFTIMSHHSQIIDQIKKNYPNVKCKKIMSLSSDEVAKELNSLL